MKRLVLPVFVLLCFIATQLGVAQVLKGDHVEVGVFADYFRIGQSNPSLNYAGLGGRLAFNVRPSVQIEGEMAYDFDRSYTNVLTNGVTTTLLRSDTHVLHGLFGPKFQTGSGPLRFFVTGKVGLINFTTNTQGVQQGFKSALGAVGSGDSKFAVYPGGGIEGFVGPIGLRFEVGDDIYFDNGARNNLRVSFGPTLRF
jgi:hypothetical protein